MAGIQNTTFGLILYVLVLIGALNWGLVGGFNMNLVETIIPNTTAERIVYIVVGIAALILIVSKFMP
jgi:uncharacterized membrane protein YuzA (DUF378 family)